MLGAATNAAAAPANNTCPAPQAALHEHFIAADCTTCWGEALPQMRALPGWRFDWIVPVDASAAMAVAALPEATERAQRVLGASGRPGPSAQTSHDRPALARRLPAGLSVVSGPAWQGYIGVEMRLKPATRQRLPPGSSAWLALVERVEAGSEGTPVARDLVRTVAGPLPLGGTKGQDTQHLRALRWPATALPERLQTRAWIEGPDGQVLAVAADRCP